MENSGMAWRARVLQARFEQNRSAMIAVLALSPAFLFLLAGLFKLAWGLGGAPSGAAHGDPRWGLVGFIFQGAIIAGPTLALILTLLPAYPLDWAARIRAQRARRSKPGQFITRPD